MRRTYGIDSHTDKNKKTPLHGKGDKMTHTEARTLKARQIRICRHYLAVAKQILGLGPQSTTVRYWTETLAEWRAMPIAEIAQHYQQRGN